MTYDEDAARRLTRRLVAIEAIATNRIADAVDLLQTILAGPSTVTSGVCRYCGCSDRTPCSIVVAAPSGGVVVRCSWIDDDETVCSNVRCIDLWRRDAPRVAVAESPRIVVP